MPKEKIPEIKTEDRFLYTMSTTPGVSLDKLIKALSALDISFLSEKTPEGIILIKVPCNLHKAFFIHELWQRSYQ